MGWGVNKRQETFAHAWTRIRKCFQFGRWEGGREGGRVKKEEMFAETGLCAL